MNVIFVMLLLLGFLPGLGMFLHARRNRFRRAFASFLIACASLPFALLILVGGFEIVLDGPGRLSWGSVEQVFRQTPTLLLWFGVPMFIGLVLGHLTSVRRRADT
ncbi:MAG: hypothetical protein AAF771_07530 [Pseudomonadota bacterium]